MQTPANTVEYEQRRQKPPDGSVCLSPSAISHHRRALSLRPSVHQFTPLHGSYPHACALRLRVLQIVCGIGAMLMGTVGLIEEVAVGSGRLTIVGFWVGVGVGLPAGLATVLAAAASIHWSRAFAGCCHWPSLRLVAADTVGVGTEPSPALSSVATITSASAAASTLSPPGPSGGLPLRRSRPARQPRRQRRRWPTAPLPLVACWLLACALHAALLAAAAATLVRRGLPVAGWNRQSPEEEGEGGDGEPDLPALAAIQMGLSAVTLAAAAWLLVMGADSNCDCDIECQPLVPARAASSANQAQPPQPAWLA